MSDLDHLRLAVRHLITWALYPTEEEAQVWKKSEQMTETPKSLSDEQQRVLAALGDEPRSTAEIAAEAMLPIAKTREVLASLHDRPGANKAGRGKWVLAPAFDATVAGLEEKLGHPVPDAVREALEQPEDATEPEPDDPVLSFEERLELALVEAQATA